MKDIKKKKVSSSGMTTKEKMLARKKDLESRGSKGNGFVFPKDGETRIRLKSPGDDQELGIELITFYLGNEKGSIYSPQTFGDPCPFMEKYLELKQSKDPADQALAKKLIPKRKFAIGGIVYTDSKGTTPDYEGKNKVVLVPRSVYQDIVELYLDEDEAGDMTDPVNGYDIKVIRSGKGQFDTSYSTRACKPSKLDKALRKEELDLEGMVRSQIKSYDELEEELNNYLNEDPEEDDEEEREEKPKKKDKLKDKKKLKKSKHGDI